MEINRAKWRTKTTNRTRGNFISIGSGLDAQVIFESGSIFARSDQGLPHEEVVPSAADLPVSHMAVEAQRLVAVPRHPVRLGHAKVGRGQRGVEGDTLFPPFEDEFKLLEEVLERPEFKILHYRAR